MNGGYSSIIPSLGRTPKTTTQYSALSWIHPSIQSPTNNPIVSIWLKINNTQWLCSIQRYGRKTLQKHIREAATHNLPGDKGKHFSCLFMNNTPEIRLHILTYLLPCFTTTTQCPYCTLYRIHSIAVRSGWLNSIRSQLEISPTYPPFILKNTHVLERERSRPNKPANTHTEHNVNNYAI